MKGYTPQAELAPRDVVARSIVSEMGKTGTDHVFIDVTHQPAAITAARFPQIYHYCLEHGLDMAKDMIPVAPAAHYMIGGIRVSTWGEIQPARSLRRGRGGLHRRPRGQPPGLQLPSGGAGVRQAHRRAQRQGRTTREDGKDWNGDIACSLKPRPPPPRTLSAARPCSSFYGKTPALCRNGPGLARAADILAGWQQRLAQPCDRPSWELLNLIITGRLMTEAALMRLESRGAHFRTDYPKVEEELAQAYRY